MSDKALVSVHVGSEDCGELKIPQEALDAIRENQGDKMTSYGPNGTVTIEMAGGLSIHICPEDGQ
jgi:hypothetical protein